MNVIGFSDWLSMMGTFAIVLTLLIFTLLGLKKMGPKLGNAYGKRIKVIETYSLGARQKLMLVTINKKEILLGVSPNGVSKLALLEGTELESDEIQDKALTEPSVKKSSFKDKIAEVLK